MIFTCKSPTISKSTLLIELNLFEDAVSRAYYAVYHAAYAVLLWLGYSPKTHKELLNLFYTQLVSQNIVEPEYLRIFSRLLNSRENADYGVIPLFFEQEVRKNYDDAAKFVKKMEELIKELT